ncbi:glycosyltransferase [Isoptericola sp. NEAU-Y5]|uniref:Glycosyltransferase n=1 Tax=Isoptericola luteus TaxID=2879484 RepID=A0ABS7ZEM3_9MICO|nr:glycosyltransferase [Isoptericola sp. NEAU-Y5]MCA5892746.1 glycosyltransferase [Isoptericola sp. NEAU-Y5]
MTSALLRRSRSFVERSGVPVRVLTFDPWLDVEATRVDLEERGVLVPGVTLHNLWDDVRRLPDDAVGASPTAPAVRQPAGETGEGVRVELGDDGDPVTHRIFRADGSLAALDVRAGRGRGVTLYSRDGRPGRHWRTTWAFYRYWVEQILPDRPAYVVVDSKALTRFFATLGSDDVYTAQVVHGAHLSSRATDAHGPLVGTRAALIEHLDDFDGVVFLTEGQRRDVQDRVGGRDNTYVIPNSTDLPPEPPDERERYRGAVVASLSSRKRVGQAIQGLRRARRLSGLELTLDVYGDGPLRERLETSAAKVPGVTLHGYVTGAADRLADASFMLLTSRAEGLPLVFAEAMSRGCVPIAYDIRYGPADAITDGVDGFLVPSGDVDALAEAICRFVTMDDEAVLRMRRAAVAAAQRYSDEAVVGRWAETFADMARRRPPAAAEQAPNSTRGEERRQGIVGRWAGMLRRVIR